MNYPELRSRMVAGQILARGIGDAGVVEAMKRVPREEFVPPEFRPYAYEDGPLPIGEGQTISQPYIVGRMTEALDLDGGEKVLEIGTGSGYAAAILSQIAGEVYTIERIAGLAERAAKNLKRLRIDNVHVKEGDGTLGWPEHAPYDAIVVTAGGPDVPASLKEQLAIGGRLVIPTGATENSQKLVRVVRTGGDEFRKENLGDVRFVPLIGEEGWKLQSA